MIKRVLSLSLIGVMLAIFTFAPAVVKAVEDGNNQTTEQEQKSENTDAEKSAREKEQKRQERIEEQKKEHQEKLKNIDENRIKNRCKASQGLVGQTNERLGVKAAERTKRYDEIQNHLAKIIDRLKAANIDTALLEQELAVFTQKVTQLKGDITGYKQNLSDLKEMDCEADPVGFQAALEAARTVRDSLIKQVSDIKTLIKDEIRPTLQELRAQLEQSEN